MLQRDGDGGGPDLQCPMYACFLRVVWLWWSMLASRSGSVYGMYVCGFRMAILCLFSCQDCCTV